MLPCEVVAASSSPTSCKESITRWPHSAPQRSSGQCSRSAATCRRRRRCARGVCGARAHRAGASSPNACARRSPRCLNTRKEVPTLKKYAEPFLDGYLPGQKPGVLTHKTQSVHTHLVQFFRGHATRPGPPERCRRVRARRAEALRTQDGQHPPAVLSTLLKYAHENMVIGKPTLHCHVGGSKAEDAPIVTVSADAFHSLRHSFGTKCARRGVPVMTLRL
jgi:hypothetical protein